MKNKELEKLLQGIVPGTKLTSFSTVLPDKTYQTMFKFRLTYVSI